MRIIDLSYPIFDGMHTYPSDPTVSIVKKKDIVQHRSLLHEFTMGTHTGTHLDVPGHIIKDGKKINDFPLSSFYCRAVKVDKKSINRLMDFEGMINGIIFETGWKYDINDPEKYYGPNRPIIPRYLIDLVIGIGVKIFGCDLPSVDASGIKDKPIHHALLGNDIIIYESLTNLKKLPLVKPFDFFGFPLSFQNLDGSPVRAVGMLES